jgi:hypothetical protein
MDKKFAFRLLMVPILMYFFYLFSWPLEIIVLLGILFIGLILVKGKIWNTSETIIERLLPFTKVWPSWAQKILLILIFFIIYIILKQILFFILGMAGINLEEMIISTYDTTKP